MVKITKYFKPFVYNIYFVVLKNSKNFETMFILMEENYSKNFK